MWPFGQEIIRHYSVWEWRSLEDISRKDELRNQSVCNQGVCRTAPATPGLLNIMDSSSLAVGFLFLQSLILFVLWSHMTTELVHFRWNNTDGSIVIFEADAGGGGGGGGYSKKEGLALAGVISSNPLLMFTYLKARLGSPICIGSRPSQIKLHQ